MSALVQKIGSPLNKFLFFSALGLFFFLVPVTIFGKSTIAIDHFVNLAMHRSIQPISIVYIIVMKGGIVVRQNGVPTGVQ